MKIKIKAFTLTELLVVLIIIGILVLLALPNLVPMISKTKSTEAKLQLQHVHTLQKAYFFTNSKYCGELNEIGFIQEPLSNEDNKGNANYTIEIVSANSNSFLAHAISVSDFDGDGIFNVWQIDQDKILTEVTPD